MKRIALLGLLLGSLAPTALLAQAEGGAQMSYSAFDVSYLFDVEIDSSVANVDGDGFEIGGSYELNDKFFLLGSWQEQSLDFGIDGRALELGGGFHTPLGKTVDFVATLSYMDAEVDAGGSSADDDGLAVGAGVRARVAESFEIDGSLKLVDFDDSGSDTGFSFGGRWYFADNMAVTAGADFFDNADTLRVGFRAEF
jgi:Outer membrane protein beta-barrel domain